VALNIVSAGRSRWLEFAVDHEVWGPRADGALPNEVTSGKGLEHYTPWPYGYLIQLIRIFVLEFESSAFVCVAGDYALVPEASKATWPWSILRIAYVDLYEYELQWFVSALDYSFDLRHVILRG